MDITPQKVERADLVVLADRDGNVEWSAHRTRPAVAAMLRSIADRIEKGTL